MDVGNSPMERESGVEKRLRDEMRAELYQNGCWRERERVDLTRGLVLELEHS